MKTVYLISKDGLYRSVPICRDRWVKKVWAQRYDNFIEATVKASLSGGEVETTTDEEITHEIINTGTIAAALAAKQWRNSHAEERTPESFKDFNNNVGGGGL